MYVYVVLCTCASTGLLTQLIKMPLRKVATTYDELRVQMNAWKRREVVAKSFCRAYIIIAATVATLFCLTIPEDTFITYIYLFLITIGIIVLIVPSVISLAVSVMLRWYEKTALSHLPFICDFSHLQQANEINQIEVGLEPWPGLQIRALKFQSSSSKFRELELANFTGLVLGCIEAKFCK